MNSKKRENHNWNAHKHKELQYTSNACDYTLKYKKARYRYGKEIKLKDTRHIHKQKLGKVS